MTKARDAEQMDEMDRAIRELQKNRQTDADTIANLTQQLRTAVADVTTLDANLVATQRRLNGAENALAAAGGAPVNPGAALGGAIPRPPRPFDMRFEAKESDDWISFRGLFENYALTQGFDNPTAKRTLKGSMRGVAYVSISQLNHEDPNITAQQMLDAYERIFLPPAASSMAQAKFDAAVQQPKETILQWHGRLFTLWMRAYPTLIAHHEMPIRRFAAGLRKTRIRDQVLRTHPADYPATLDAAHAEQSIVDSSHLLLGQMPTSNFGPTQGGPEPMEIGAIDTIKCHNCQGYGHLAKKCPSQPRNGKLGPSKPTGAYSKEKEGENKIRGGKKSEPTTGGNWRINVSP
jgi:hypothetical protein